MNSITLSPAYGRTYRSKKEVLSSLSAGHDFIIQSLSRWVGKPINLRQLRENNYTHVEVRYGPALSKVTFFPLSSIKETL